MRDAAVAIIREMGVECGGSNVQMGIDPEDGTVSGRAISYVIAESRAEARLLGC